MKRTRILTRVLPAVLALIGVSAPAFASAPGLREEVAAHAKDIKAFLDGRDEDAISVGAFTGPANIPTSSGPSIAQLFTEELKKLKVNVKTRAKLGITGQYRPADDQDADKNKIVAVEIKGSIQDAFGKVYNTFTFKVKTETGFAEMMGVSVDLQAKDVRNKPEKRAEKLKEAIQDPMIVKETGSTTILKASAESPYAMEILCGGKGRDIKSENDLSFVDIAKEETYVVKLYNKSKYDAAVRLHIDGISVFSFSELRHPDTKEPLYTVYIIPANSHLEVVGWHINNQKSDEFLVTDYAKSAAFKLDQKTDVGTITASFAAAWTGDDVPSDEPNFKRDPNIGTGFGKRIDAPLVEVHRTVGTVRATISVRYVK
jgi:hypothetical protein